jgi:myo-inositol-1(or 4)-monophosphatase
MLSSSAERQYLARIESSFAMAAGMVGELGKPSMNDEHGRQIIKDAELRLSQELRKILLRPGEGWLCEEDVDNGDRLDSPIVWVVDPVDGTNELMNGLPEWSISVGLVVEGTAVAGGVYNPPTRELFLGSLSLGVTYNRQPMVCGNKTNLDGALLLASRQEFIRGEWARFQGRNFSVRPTGSIAYKLSLVSVGLADATWTLSPKHEWDVAAGVALVRSSGGCVSFLGSSQFQLNRKETLLPGLVASGEGLWRDVNSLVAEVVASHPVADCGSKPAANQNRTEHLQMSLEAARRR